MTETTTTPLPAAHPETIDAWPCSWDNSRCPNRATHALRFRDQAGHVHECDQHTAECREWFDVVEVKPMPCRWFHGDGRGWSDDPRPLT